MPNRPSQSVTLSGDDGKLFLVVASAAIIAVLMHRNSRNHNHQPTVINPVNNVVPSRN